MIHDNDTQEDTTTLLSVHISSKQCKLAVPFIFKALFISVLAACFFSLSKSQCSILCCSLFHHLLHRHQPYPAVSMARNAKLSSSPAYAKPSRSLAHIHECWSEQSETWTAPRISCSKQKALGTHPAAECIQCIQDSCPPNRRKWISLASVQGTGNLVTSSL